MKKHSEWFKGLQACELMIKDGKVCVSDFVVKKGCVKARNYFVSEFAYGGEYEYEFARGWNECINHYEDLLSDKGEEE